MREANGNAYQIRRIKGRTPTASALSEWHTSKEVEAENSPNKETKEYPRGWLGKYEYSHTILMDEIRCKVQHRQKSKTKTNSLHPGRLKLVKSSSLPLHKNKE